ncbi:dTDP-4-dehydrorhamnose reductase [Thiomicrorhabdus sp. Kp2]|uniref:dTDP-4-dehydrorhamnose reductase n=1 Tax=Thiomicrorhabdus sp. Kp2 TaxID=1123518 RepID=UPI0003FC21D7|nr:dTDP-4-dehydrorhamnose reductase [Thiomicrorhabdus sp. Kp2]
MLKKTLVTGKDGQLGQSLLVLKEAYPLLDMTFVGRNELDLSSATSIKDYFKEKAFDVIINCAAYTAVDKAESEPELADQINHIAVKQLAEIAKQQDSVLIHISTDYVFNGQNYKPYIETDETDPQNVYGSTKLKGEQAIQAINPKGCIIRTSWVYSEYGNNFVKTMLRLGKEKEQLGIIFDQVGTPTYTGDLAETILQIVNSKQLVVSREYNNADANLLTTHHALLTKNEVFHFSNEGVCSWYDFAKTIFELNGVECQVNPIETKDYPVPATRPHYSLMNKAKIKQVYNLEMPYWKDSLKVCLQKLQEQA